MNYILNTLKPIPLKDKFFKILSKLNTLENEIISKSFFVKSTLIEDIIFIIVLILLCILKSLCMVYCKRLTILLKTYLLISLIDYFSIKIDTIIYVIKILTFTLTNIFLISD